MSKGWRIALAILGLLTVLVLGAGMVLLASFDPTLRGLRPHATFSDLKEYSVADLSNLSNDPAFNAILIRDSWHERQGSEKHGASGWFVLTGEDLHSEDLRFEIKGALDYNPKFFVSGPKRCNVSAPTVKAVFCSGLSTASLMSALLSALSSCLWCEATPTRRSMSRWPSCEPSWRGLKRLKV